MRPCGMSNDIVKIQINNSIDDCLIDYLLYYIVLLVKRTKIFFRYFSEVMQKW